MAFTDIDDPTAYFQTTLYVGNNGTQTVTHGGNSDIQADWIWGKARNDTASHFIIDSVRGVSKRFKVNNADAEATVNTGITAIGSDSFAVGNDGDFNDNNINYVTWNWKAGTAVSGNTTGSGTAKAYSGSVNTDAGFSIITYLGNGTAGHTIPHHLGVVPQIVIVKERANANSWYTYHHSLGNTKNIYLNGDHAAQTDGVWNDTTPTSSVFTLVDGAPVNRNDGTTVAYCFAEKQGYSKFGSYVGNGNADGTFVYTGFKPAFVITKPANKTGEWFIIDNKRDPLNHVRRRLKSNGNAAENTDDNQDFDILSNGFKPRRSAGDWNSSGDTFIYIAFAEQPFVTSTGVPATAR